MSDLISRQAAIDVFNGGAELLRRVLDDADIVGAERTKFEWGLELIESGISDIKDLPSAQPERKKGKWIYSPEFKIIGNPYGQYRCDQCQTIVGYATHFCPNCGAEMRGEEE